MHTFGLIFFCVCVCDFFEFKDLFVLFLILKVIMHLTVMLMISVCFSRAQNCKERYFTNKLQILMGFLLFTKSSDQGSRTPLLTIVLRLA